MKNINIIDFFYIKDGKATVWGSFYDMDEKKWFIADHDLEKDVLYNHQFYFNPKEAQVDFQAEEQKKTKNFYL